MKILLCVLPTWEQQKVVPEGTGVVLFTGSWHQTLTDLCLLALLFGPVYPFSWEVVSVAHDVLFILGKAAESGKSEPGLSGHQAARPSNVGSTRQTQQPYGRTS